MSTVLIGSLYLVDVKWLFIWGIIPGTNEICTYFLQFVIKVFDILMLDFSREYSYTAYWIFM
jgi:hypothetical protein